MGRRLSVAAVTLAIAATALFSHVAAPHGAGEWIGRGDYKNPVGELCCGERDCSYMIAGQVKATPEGYEVDAVFRLEFGGTSTDQYVKEFVPYREATPSLDGIYWRCFWGGKRKCFFVPPTSM